MKGKGTEKSGGKYHLDSISLRNPNATGARGIRQNLPVGRGAQFVESKIYSKQNYVRIDVDNVGEAHSASKETAWTSLKLDQLKRAAKDFAQDINRQLNGAGHGAIAEIASVTGSGPYVCTPTTYESQGSSGLPGLNFNVKHVLEVNMYVAWGTPAQFATAGDGDGYISSVAADGSTFTITVVNGNAPAAADVVVRGDLLADASNNYDKEMMGIAGIFDPSYAPETGNKFQDIDTDDYPEWFGKHFQNSDSAGTLRVVDEVDMQSVLDYVEYETTGEGCSAIYCHPDVRAAYANALKARNLERFQPTKVKGGYNRRYLSFHGNGKDIPLVEDKQHVNHRMDFMDESGDQMKVYQVKGFHWDESSGGMWKWNGSTDGLTGFGKLYANAGTKNRKSCASLVDIMTDAA